MPLMQSTVELYAMRIRVRSEVCVSEWPAAIYVTLRLQYAIYCMRDVHANNDIYTLCYTMLDMQFCVRGQIRFHVALIMTSGQGWRLDNILSNHLLKAVILTDTIVC